MLAGRRGGDPPGSGVSRRDGIGTSSALPTGTVGGGHKKETQQCAARESTTSRRSAPRTRPPAVCPPTRCSATSRCPSTRALFGSTASATFSSRRVLGLALLVAGCVTAGGEGFGLVLTVTDVDQGRVLAQERVPPGA